MTRCQWILSKPYGSKEPKTCLTGRGVEQTIQAGFAPNLPRVYQKSVQTLSFVLSLSTSQWAKVLAAGDLKKPERKGWRWGKTKSARTLQRETTCGNKIQRLWTDKFTSDAWRANWLAPSRLAASPLAPVAQTRLFCSATRFLTGV